MRFKKGEKPPVGKPFQKLVSGNPSGRPKGTFKKPAEKRVEAIIHKNLDKIEKDLETAAPEERQNLIVRLITALKGGDFSIGIKRFAE